MRDGTLRIAASLILLVSAGCESHHGPTTSSASLSTVDDVSIKPLTAEFSNQTVRYQVTAQVTNPQNLVGGTGELTVAASGQARRHGASLEIGQVLASAPITQANLSGNQLVMIFDIKNPPTGTLPLDFLVIDPKGFATNPKAIKIFINQPPEPPVVPVLFPGTLVIRELEGQGPGTAPFSNGSPVVSNLVISGPDTRGPLTLKTPMGQATFLVKSGSYTALASTAYFPPHTCPATPFTVSSGGTTTLTYTVTRTNGSVSVTCTVGVT